MNKQAFPLFQVPVAFFFFYTKFLDFLKQSTCGKLNCYKATTITTTTTEEKNTNSILIEQLRSKDYICTNGCKEQTKNQQPTKCTGPQIK